MPLRVSMAAGWPMVTSLACVSGMRSTALSRPGLHDPRERGAALGPLPDLERQLLQDAVGARPSPPWSGRGPRWNSVDVAEPVDLGLLQRELRVGAPAS